MSFYDIDFVKHVTSLLERKRRIMQPIDWVMSLLKPITVIHADFLAFRTLTLNEMAYTSQTIVLEYVLNLKLNAGGTEIFITNHFTSSPSVYTGHLDEAGFLQNIGHLDEGGSPVYIGHLDEYVDISYDFTVNVPAALVYDLNELLALVNKYKPIGKRYNVITY
jgi:hypothetical protein